MRELAFPGNWRIDGAFNHERLTEFSFESLVKDAGEKVFLILGSQGEVPVT